jgi:tRNA dimethylallyltransferase
VAAAQRLGGQIISADSRQVYRRMDIGTGKDLEEYGQGSGAIPVHLIDVAEPGDEFNLFAFQQGFVSAWADISSHGALPVLCGGTGLYIDSVLSRYKLAEWVENIALRQELQGVSMAELTERLGASRDLHNSTDTTDRERLLRAIEIAAAPDPEESAVPELRADVFGLTLSRDRLRENIARRLKSRLENGLVEEVEGLLKICRPEQLEFYGLEYRLVTAFVSGKLNRNDMFQKLNSQIFQFAKRQEKWFRRMERKGVQISWLDADQPLDQRLDAVTSRYRSGARV